MSNSGTLTSCLADFMRLPIPALRATRSPSSLNSSLVAGTGDLSRVGEPVGDALRVVGAVVTSMSMRIDDLLRSAGSSAKRVEIGLGGCRARLSRTTVDGLSNDHVRTRSNASAWQPRGRVTRALISKVNEGHTHFAEYTSGLQDEVELGATGDLAGTLCCLQRFRLQLRKE